MERARRAPVDCSRLEQRLPGSPCSRVIFTTLARVRFGIAILPEYPWSQARPLWARAEAYGFDHAWTYDHLSWRTLADGPWFSAIPTLTAAALATSTLRIGTLVASPNYRHPVPFAKELTTLDEISGGRLNLGLGAGGIGFDATVLGADVLPPKERADRFTEFVDLLDELLTADHTTYAGRYFEAADARTVPLPVQAPRIPFVVAANGPRMMRLALRQGAGWVTTGTSDPADGLEAWWTNIESLAARFTEVEQQEQRSEPIDRYLHVDASGVPALSSVEYFRECVGHASELGFTDLIIHWPRRDGVYCAKQTVLEAVVAEFLR